MKVADLLHRVNTIECGYRIVETDDERYAFVWGNTRARVGDTLDQARIDDPTADVGIEVYDTYSEAIEAWGACADALRANGDERAASAMESVARPDRENSPSD